VITSAGKKVEMLVPVVTFEACRHEFQCRLWQGARGEKTKVKISWRSDMGIPTLCKNRKGWATRQFSGPGSNYAGFGGNQIPGMPCPVCHPSNLDAATDIYSSAAVNAGITLATEGMFSGFRALSGIQITGLTTVGPSGVGSGGEASEALLNLMRAHGRNIIIAQEGTEALRYLDARGAEGLALDSKTMILRPGASKATALEEFLHTTQFRLGSIEKGVGGYDPAEASLMNFMRRHAKLLGLQP
jgi:hypothetical protein